MATTTTTVPRAWRQQLFYLIYLALSAAAVYYMRIASDGFDVSGQLTKIIESEKFTQNGLRLRTKFTGVSTIDQGLSFLVAVFTPAAAGFDRGFYLQALHFLASFFPVVTVWAVESCRKGNAWAVISL